MRIIFYILSVFSLVFIGCGDDVGTKIGQKSPQINAKTTNGEKIKLKGSGVEIVLFWESGCAGCISAMPHLEEFLLEHKALIYAINSINKKEIIKKFQNENNFSNIKILEDTLNISWDNYGVNFVPSMFVIKDGIIVDKILGDRTWNYIKPKLLPYF